MHINARPGLPHHDHDCLMARGHPDRPRTRGLGAGVVMCRMLRRVLRTKDQDLDGLRDLMSLGWRVRPSPLGTRSRRTPLTVDGVILVACVIVMLVIARTGRGIIAGPDDDDEAKTRPLVRMLAGLAALSVGGEVLGEGIRATVSRFGGVADASR